jgi:hypothetical protein
MRARSASGWSNYNPPGIGIQLPDPTVKAPEKPTISKDATTARKVTVDWPQLNYYNYGPPV